MLLATWPSQRVLDAILSFPDSISELFDIARLTLWSTTSGSDAQSAPEMLQQHPPGTHPVLIAQSSILLGLYLQGAWAHSLQVVNGPSVSELATIMSRIMETSHDLVTNNDDLMDCWEGIECLILETMYYNNEGTLRRAWFTIRRAMLVAQTMGLHNGSEPKMLFNPSQPGTQDNSDTMHLWFRIVQIDRYLSLMLGLPLGYLDNNFADPKAMEGCTPRERMQRLQCVASGDIIRCSQGETDDLVSTYETDTLLHKASSLMPSTWWLLPAVADGARDSRETVRTMDVLTHHWLLLRLHLQYLLRLSADQRYDYSKITAVSAGREVISWFIRFRESTSKTVYCRGLDFLAFVGSTALCIAYLEAHRQRHRMNLPQGIPDCYSSFRFLVHQRLSDRGLMERTLAIMQSTARDGTDRIATKITSILRHLLEIEADAAAGGSYNTDSASGNSTGGEDKLEFDGNLSEGGKVLRIYIPYFGTVKIERGGVTKSVVSLPELSRFTSGACSDQPFSPAQGDGNLVPSSFPLDGPHSHQLGCPSTDADWQVLPSLIPPPSVLGVSQSNSDCYSAPDPPLAGGASSEELLVSGIAVDINDWALQGVDMAFFDSLLCESTVQKPDEIQY
ncbi:hypothetical protein G7046_g4418 [Stylonectria norvegica]|nr:hypothetical protein G7046_g4418 [Stylonectria norvegica]